MGELEGTQGRAKECRVGFGLRIPQLNSWLSNSVPFGKSPNLPEPRFLHWCEEEENALSERWSVKGRLKIAQFLAIYMTVSVCGVGAQSVVQWVKLTERPTLVPCKYKGSPN